jgi:hypothetical protein
MRSLDDLREEFPWVDWTKPVMMTVIGKPPGYSCRICLVNEGTSGAQEPRFATNEQALLHIHRKHQREG